MKKIMIATGVAVLAVAMIASAQGYAFKTNLTVGSTGADVVALQTWLISSGYSIPSVVAKTAAPGYFGSQTKTAVQAYQTAKGLPSTGFVGPLTLKSLNGSAVATTPNPSACPVGYDCIPKGTTPGTVVPGTVVPGTVVVGTPAGIMTPNVVGTLAASLWSTPSNGTTVYKSQSYDVATLKLQAGASDMAVQNLSVDFNERMWLYAGAITVKDETGAVLGTVSNLNKDSFTELTVAADYRISVPVSSLIVKATQSKYLTVNVSFLSSSDRCATTCVLGVTSFQVRSVDGTGVTDTETVALALGIGGVTGVPATNGVTVIRSFSYAGTNSGNLVMAIDNASPKQGQVSISTSGQTQDVLLAVYSIKPSNQAATLRSLKVGINTSSAVTTLFANLKIKVAGMTTPVSASTIATTSIFDNLAITLPADTYTTISIYGTVNQDTNNTLDGITASTSLILSTTNVTVEDTSFNQISMASSGQTLRTSALTFTASAATVTSQSFAIQDPGSTTSGRNKDTLFTGSFTLATGNSGVYVSATPATAFVTASNAATSALSTFTTADGTQGSDISGSFFYVGPNSSRVFNIGGSLNNTGGTAGAKNFGVSKIYFTDDTNSAQKYNINYNLQGLNSDGHINVLLGI